MASRRGLDHEDLIVEIEGSCRARRIWFARIKPQSPTALGVMNQNVVAKIGLAARPVAAAIIGAHDRKQALMREQPALESTPAAGTEANGDIDAFVEVSQ